MIGIVDVEIQAANPQMPLYPMRAFVNSPSSVRVRNVPTEVGAWKITSVRVVVAYPDSSIKTADCVLAGSVWVATVAGCAVSGKTENGFTVFASGVDENGDAVSNYCLGKGAVEILQADGTLSPDAPSYYVHLFDEAPEAPNEGDMWPTADGFVIWHDGEAHALGGSSITVDSALSQTSENPVQNKVVTKALSAKLDGAAAYPAWDSTAHYLQGIVVSYGGRLWKAKRDIPYPPPDAHEPPPDYDDAPWDEVFLKDLKQDALTSAQLAAANSGATAAKVATWDGYAAQIAAKANSADVNAALAQKASIADLPYRLVEPGEWEFSDGVTHTITGPSESIGGYNYYADSVYASQEFDTEADALDALMLDFTEFTATRASLPGHLLDRAGNRVVVSGDTTLTLPALEHAGRLRDFLVRLEISGSTVPTITFQGQGSEAPNGADEITYETDGDEFPVPDAEGTWLYSFTESCVAHKFAVSLKKVNAVTQGGS